MMMKKKYIIPSIEVALCLLDGFIAASDESADSTVDDKKDPMDTSDDVNIKAKGFDAWTAWDE